MKGKSENGQSIHCTYEHVKGRKQIKEKQGGQE